MAVERKSNGEKKTREAILDAAAAIMREEGYAAVTSRRVGQKAGLNKSKLVHYYFGTMDDLFIALYERNEKIVLDLHLKAMAARNPLRALWQAALHQPRSALGLEFIALSNHRKAIRELIARTSE